MHTRLVSAERKTIFAASTSASMPGRLRMAACEPTLITTCSPGTERIPAIFGRNFDCRACRSSVPACPSSLMAQWRGGRCHKISTGLWIAVTSRSRATNRGAELEALGDKYNYSDHYSYPLIKCFALLTHDVEGSKHNEDL
jgi:hypothetical protein